MWLVIIELQSGKNVLREIKAPNFELAAKLAQQEADDNDGEVLSIQRLQN